MEAQYTYIQMENKHVAEDLESTALVPAGHTIHSQNTSP